MQQELLSHCEFDRDKELGRLVKLDTNYLFEQYQQTGCEMYKWAIVLQHVEVVRIIARQTYHIFSDHVEFEDVVQEGIIELLNAVDKYDPDRGVKFGTFVEKRIRGKIFDLACKYEGIPRQLRQNAIQIFRTAEQLTEQYGRTSTDQEIADHLGITLKKYKKTINAFIATNVLSFEAFLQKFEGEPRDEVHDLYRDPELDQPEEMLQTKEIRDVLADGIKSLRDREQIVLSLYYEKELSMKEIAKVLNISAPRVSQIHSRALEKLRDYLSTYFKGESPQAERKDTDGKRVLQSDIRHAVTEPSTECDSKQHDQYLHSRI